LVREEQDITIHHAERLASGIACLATENVDIVLLDLGLPDSQGLETLQRIIEVGRRVPVVVLTGRDDEALGEAAVREGAQDYLVKSRVVEPTLVRAIRYAIERNESQVRLHHLNRLLRAVRNVDQLIVHERDPKKLIEQACNLLVETQGYAGTWMVVQAGPHAVGYVAGSGRCKPTEADAEQLRRSPPPPCWARANGASDGFVVLRADDNCAPCTFAPCCAEMDSMVTALVHDGVSVGHMGIQTSAEVVIDDEERALVLELCADLAFALNTIARGRQWWEADERFRIGFEKGAVGQAMTALDGRFVRVNEALAKMLQYLPSELEGKSFNEVTHPEDRGVNAHALGVLMDGKETARFEKRYVAKDGACVWVDGNVALVRDANSQPQYFISTFVDITDRKRAQAEREDLEAQLRVSQKMEAIGSLAGGVAHDFNNLLSVILTFTGFAMQAVGERHTVREDLLEVKGAAERAAVLTRQLLAFSRKQVLQPARLNLNQVAAKIEKMLRRILREDVEFVQVLAPDLGWSMADAGQIEQVLMNLVVNAGDAMPEGGTLTLETSNVQLDDSKETFELALKPGPYVKLAVSDTGCGMDEMTRLRVFEPFFTTKDVGKGTGLGLSTVYGIVKQSGGGIKVQSTPGSGSAFEVYLPRELSSPSPRIEAPVPATGRSTGTETLLVVEDDECLRRIAKRTFESAGYRVLTAAQGEEALLLFAEHHGNVDLLLTDVVMPRMSGSELAQRLVKSRPSLKVLYMSGYTDDAIIAQGVLAAGANFLAKPFTAQDLMRKVREVLDRGAIGPVTTSTQAAEVNAADAIRH
jgi:PAS domain S-box-containing protein